MMMMNFNTTRKISFDISGQNYYAKTRLNYIPNERTRLGKPLKKLLDEPAAGLKA
jgi:hypothetical protein